MEDEGEVEGERNVQEELHVKLSDVVGVVVVRWWCWCSSLLVMES